MTSNHRSYHESLKPGISISGVTSTLSACTLGALFETEAEPGKRFILTTKHGVGDEGTSVIQPSTIDGGTMKDHCAKVSRYTYYGIDDESHMLDYAFCEIDGRDVENPSNRPYGTKIVIKSIKKNVSGAGDVIEVQKVGRTSAHTHGRISDKYTSMRYSDIGKNQIKALNVYGDFCQFGDAGAPVFDQNGQLCGIIQGIKSGIPAPEAIVIPIHLILEHVKRKFNVEFRLIQNNENLSSEVSEQLCDRKVLPIEDIEVLEKLEKASDSLWDEYKKTSSLTYVSSGMVDGEPVLIALVRLPKANPVDLPGKFRGYRVIIDYGGIKPTHRSRHEELKPGISIGSGNDTFTLGPLFKTDDDKRYLLTVEHGTRGSNLVIQPGRSDQGISPADGCARPGYSFYGIVDGFFLDYAFCEVHGIRQPIPRNIPFGTHNNVIINGFRENFETPVRCPVRKVGRTTGYTTGNLRDRWIPFEPQGLNQEARGLIVSGIRFSDEGDSGSPVFEDDGTLWGIIHGIPEGEQLGILNEAFVVPIHVILNDAKSRFDITFSLM